MSEFPSFLLDTTDETGGECGQNEGSQQEKLGHKESD